MRHEIGYCNYNPYVQEEEREHVHIKERLERQKKTTSNFQK